MNHRLIPRYENVNDIMSIKNLTSGKGHGKIDNDGSYFLQIYPTMNKTGGE
jgi:hypothetical protein